MEDTTTIMVLKSTGFDIVEVKRAISNSTQPVLHHLSSRFDHKECLSPIAYCTKKQHSRCASTSNIKTPKHSSCDSTLTTIATLVGVTSKEPLHMVNLCTLPTITPHIHLDHILQGYVV